MMYYTYGRKSLTPKSGFTECNKALIESYLQTTAHEGSAH